MRTWIKVCLIAVTLTACSCTQLPQRHVTGLKPRLTSPNKPTDEELEARIDELLGQIASDKYKQRENATEKLISLLNKQDEKFGNLVEYLEKRVKEFGDDEIGHRFRTILDPSIRPWKYFQLLIEVRQGVLSPDGRLLATSVLEKQDLPDGRSKTREVIGILNARTGKNLCTLADDSMDSVYATEFSSDGKLLASIGRDDLDEGCRWSLGVWDIEKGAYLHTLMTVKDFFLGWCCCISPDGNLIASTKGRKICVWNACTGDMVHTLTGHEEAAWYVTFSPDGKLLASGDFGGLVRIWDSRTGKCTHTLKGHTSIIRLVMFSPDGKLLVSASWDKTVRIWDAASGKCVRVLKGHRKRLWSVAFSPDGELLATSGAEGALCIWEVETGKCLHVLKDKSFWCSSIAFAPDDRFLAWASAGRKILLCNPRTGQVLRKIEHSTPTEVAADSYSHVQFSPDGKLMIYRDGYGTGYLYSVSGK